MRRVRILGHCVMLALISFMSGMAAEEWRSPKDCEPAVNIGAWRTVPAPEEAHEFHVPEAWVKKWERTDVE